MHLKVILKISPGFSWWPCPRIAQWEASGCSLMNIDLNVLSLSGFSKKFAGSAVLLFCKKSRRRKHGRRPGPRVVGTQKATVLKTCHSLAVVSVFIDQMKRGLGCSLSQATSGFVIMSSRDKYIQLLM